MSNHQLQLTGQPVVSTRTGDAGTLDYWFPAIRTVGRVTFHVEKKRMEASCGPMNPPDELRVFVDSIEFDYRTVEPTAQNLLWNEHEQAAVVRTLRKGFRSLYLEILRDDECYEE